MVGGGSPEVTKRQFGKHQRNSWETIKGFTCRLFYLPVTKTTKLPPKRTNVFSQSMTMDALTCKDKRLFTKDEDTLSDLTRFIPFESINVLKKWISGVFTFEF